MMTLLDTSILNFSKRALQVFGLVLRVGGWIGILYSGLDLQNSNKRLSLPSYNNTIWSNDDNLYGSSHVPFIQHASLHLFQLSSAAISLTQSSFLHTRQEGQPAGTRVWNQIIIYFFRPPETNALLVLVSLFTNETLRGWRRGDRPFQDKTDLSKTRPNKSYPLIEELSAPTSHIAARKNQSKCEIKIGRIRRCANTTGTTERGVGRMLIDRDGFQSDR